MGYVRRHETILANARAALANFLQKYRDVAISHGEVSITIEAIDELESLIEDVEYAHADLVRSETSYY
jgi:hypothetical protein